MQTMTVLLTLTQLAFIFYFFALFCVLDPFTPRAEARPLVPVNDVTTFTSDGRMRLLHLPRKV